MADTISKEHRSWLMGQVKTKDTKPEILLRKLLHKVGFRYRLHPKNLPGSPDIVLPKYKAVIFVHGCFWHRHKNCRRCTTPKSNVDFWQEKFDKNIKRDNLNAQNLIELGWSPIIIWECELDLKNRMDTFGKLFDKLKLLITSYS